MLCIVLLSCVGTAANSMDIEKEVTLMIRSDFAVVNADSTNGQKGLFLREQAILQQTVEDIAAQPGVFDGSLVLQKYFGRYQCDL